MLLRMLKLAVLAIAINVVSGDTNYRLNTTITPSAYTLAITPYFDTGDDTAFTYDGEVTILFTTDTNIKQIKLHSENLTFTSSNITLTTGLATVTLDPNNPLEFDEVYTFAHINFLSEIQAGVQYSLKIVYKGPIRKDLRGFYRNSYIENGVKKWLGATQLEPTHARKVFPCFDEPALKATFTLAVDRPEHYQPTLSNTKIQSTVLLSNGYIRELFYPTPKMSTYLVAFLVSEFEAGSSITVGTNEFGVYTRPEAKNQTEFAFEFGRKVVEALGNYFGIDYYSVNSNLRLDHVALIDFNSGAMENWGLIKYRESRLLYVPEHSTPYYKQKIAEIIAHETTHMWFGNLVTCHWWSNTWLNEGFADYFQNYITSLVEPEIKAEDALLSRSVYSAYNADDSPTSPPISNSNVNSPAEISGHFGAITYQKAGSVIRMMHHLVGDDAFKFGLNSYLEANKFEPGYPDKLYAGLHTGVTQYSSLSAYPETDITAVMSSWITQSGYPIVHVDVNREEFTVTLTQTRFYINASDESSELYKIPITYTIGNAPDFSDTKPAFVMHDKTHVFNVSRTTEPLSWVMLNIQETGFYRVNYDSQTWNLITAELKGDNREDIHHLNRAKIVNDLFAFLYADEVSFETLHEVLGFLKEETNYPVWIAALDGFEKLRKSYLGSDALEVIDEFALELVESAINKLGLEVKATDDFVTLRNRQQLLEFACKLGHQGCIDNALALFKDLKDNGQEITPSLRPVAYCTGLRYGNGEDYLFLWNRMATTNVANEAVTISSALGCSSDESSLRSYLVSMLIEDSPIRTQDLTVPVTSVLSNYTNVNVVLDELNKNVTLWRSIYSSMDSVLSSIGSALHTEKELNDYDAWLTTCTECGEQAVTTAKSSVARARAATAWADDHKADIVNSLRSHAVNPSATILVLLFGVLIAMVVS